MVKWVNASLNNSAKTNIILVRLELDSYSLSKISYSSLVDDKNMVQRKDPTKGGKLSFPAKYRRNRWILRTNIG